MPEFPLASAIVADAKGGVDELKRICARVAEAGPGRLYLLIGSTDRLPLEGTIRRQYDANVGLAKAVKDYMLNQCSPKVNPEENVLLSLVAGPQQTDRIEGKVDPSVPAGYGIDRRVDVYRLSIVPIETAGRQEVVNPPAGPPKGAPVR